MASPQDRPRSDATITMRVAARTRDLIDSAAAVQGKSRTKFMVESDALAEALANPPRPNAALRALLRTKAPWA